MEYKNISETTQIIGNEKIEAGKILKTNAIINNKNFKLVTSKKNIDDNKKK